VHLEVGDFNLDARQEVRLENDRLIALVRPALGGHVYELDVRHNTTNVLATLDRRLEAYHANIIEAARHPASQSNADGITLKMPGLDQLLVYDRYPRKALVDHFYPNDIALADLVAGRETELGDFVTGTYLAKVQREADRVKLLMERPGAVNGHSIRIRKSIELVAGSPTLSVHYQLEDLPPDTALHFAVEINLAAMAGHASDRYYSDATGAKLGLLDDRLDLSDTPGLALTDEWLNLAINLRWSKSARLWCFPIETVSQCEGSFEGVFQSSAVIPHWNVTSGENGRWEVQILWRLDQIRSASPMAFHEPNHRLVEVASS
jgi:alpha-amylase